MTRRFTPPPWHIVPHGDGDSLVICHDEEAMLRICFMATPGLFGSWDTIKANARLIAAAPELYALGEVAVLELEQSLALVLESHCLLNDQLEPIRDTLEDDVRGEVERLEGAIAAARTLLAKALGDT